MDHSIGIDEGIKASEHVECASVRDVDKTPSENEVAHESDKLLPPVVPEDSEIKSSTENDLPPIKEPPDKPLRRLSTPCLMPMDTAEPGVSIFLTAKQIVVFLSEFLNCCTNHHTT